jgi:hypothetical protein
MGRDEPSESTHGVLGAVLDERQSDLARALFFGQPLPMATAIAARNRP